jgi:hypothetical protein
VQASSGSFGGHRLGHSGMIGDPRHHGREVTARREQRCALDDIPAGWVRAREPLHEGVDLSIAGAVLCAHENSVTE